jgi:hypothetical protein
MVDPISFAKRYDRTAPYKSRAPHWSDRIIDITVFPFAMVIAVVLVGIMLASIALAWPSDDNQIPERFKFSGMCAVCVGAGVAAGLLWRIVFPL